MFCPDFPFRSAAGGKSFRLKVTITSALPFGRGKDVTVFGIVRHAENQLFIGLDAGFWKMAAELACQVSNFFRWQIPTEFQISPQLRQDAVRPLWNVQSRCLGQTQQRVPHGGRQENTCVWYRDEFFICGRQSEPVVNAVFHCLSRHLTDGGVPLAVSLIAERSHVFQIDAPMSSDPVKRYLPFIEKAYQKLPGNSQETCCLLACHLLRRLRQRNDFSVRQILYDLPQKTILPVGESNFMDSADRLPGRFPQTAAKFRDIGFPRVLDGGGRHL